MSELTLEQALILLDESRQHNAAMLNRLYESLGIDSSDGEIRFKWAMIAIEDIKRERDNALAQNAKLVAQLVAIQDAALKPRGATRQQWIDNIKRHALTITAREHLSDRDAEVGRAGFLEGVRQMAENEIGWFGHDADSCANHYAEKVRRGI